MVLQNGSTLQYAFYEEGLENKIKNLMFVWVVKCMMGDMT